MKAPQPDEPQLNYEQLGEAVAKLDHKELAQAAAAVSGAAGGAAATAVNVAQLCKLYKAVKPFLAIIAQIPFIPGAVKTAIKTFMGAMNLLCP